MMEEQVIRNRRMFLRWAIILVGYLVVPISAKTPLFIFGDSLLDAGNNNYINTSTLAQANFEPYGNTFFHFPTGRCSNGRLICDFIAQHAKLPLIPPYLQPGQHSFYDGVNFASIGAGALVETYQGMVINLHTQFEFYKKVESLFKNKLGDIKTRKILTKAVYLFSIGGNDYGRLFATNSTLSATSLSKSDYVDMVIGNITNVITEIYKAGGRKFAFLNVPNMGCIPSARMQNTDGKCIEVLSSYAILHNEVLVHALQQLKMHLPGFKYSLFDFFNGLQKRIDHPSQFGFKEGKTACCGTGKFRGIFSCGGKRPITKEYELCEDVDDYVFWDSNHPTEKFYKEIANEMWNSHAYGSCSLSDLFYLP